MDLAGRRHWHPSLRPYSCPGIELGQQYLRTPAGHPGAMTEYQLRDELAQMAANEVARHREFSKAVSVTLGLFPLIYGLMTFVFGTNLWDDPGGMHALALEVPGAPESWGAVFAGIGTGIIASSLRRQWKWWAVGFNAAAAFVMAVFMGAFVLSGALPDALDPALSYGVFSVLFLHRARLSWAS